ncbi:MAG: Ham1 family protein [Candidatus Parvarchaeum acidiphilum ARMAN-4]|jgi:inosine triphosphate pyrophosphatase|uniref:Ham1 family protein n=1 Tax=Candidatus Parvarchaeum acidiphilum ARMAN-4 TaxID=662760 RepID=D2EFW0_PARA4|nr:MAG: Ham1 family protein [Candidatus Parvarchaeum acidiphilum ARMAN-4]
MEIFYVTSNDGKFLEASKLLPALKKLSLNLEEVQSLDPVEIAKNKALSAIKQTGAENLVVDDVSIYLEAFDYKLPGPLIKWFLLSIGSKGIWDTAKKFKKYGAFAVCTLCYADKRGKIKVFTGKVKGKVVKSNINSNKSWDYIFMPEGEVKTFAQMSLSEKNKISHRGIAIQKLKKYLRI